MLADSIPAAQFALTETSAHPVSKSSFERRLHDPTPTQKRPYLGPGAALCPSGVIGASCPPCLELRTPGHLSAIDALGHCTKSLRDNPLRG
jgi:hypothetical protein